MPKRYFWEKKITQNKTNQSATSEAKEWLNSSPVHVFTNSFVKKRKKEKRKEKKKLLNITLILESTDFCTYIHLMIITLRQGW